MALQNKRIAGVRELVLGSERFETIGNGSYSPGGEERESVVGDTAVVGFKSSARIPFIEVDIFVTGETDIASLLARAGDTVMLVLKNTKAFVLREAAYTGDGTVNASEGTMTVRFEGVSGEEITV